MYIKTSRQVLNVENQSPCARTHQFNFLCTRRLTHRQRQTDRQGEYTGTRTGTGTNGRKHTHEHESGGKSLKFNPKLKPSLLELKFKETLVSFFNDRSCIFDSDSGFIRIKYDLRKMNFENDVPDKIRVRAC